MNRKQIIAKIAANTAKIEELSKHNDELTIQGYQINDKEQQYFEEEQTWGKGKKATKHIVGLITWKQDFFDEDTGNAISVDRHKMVRLDGVWQI